jgi:hypothetical protein
MSNSTPGYICFLVDLSTTTSTRQAPPNTHIFSRFNVPSNAKLTIIAESHERVASLIYAPKLDRLLCASAFRLNFAPYDKFLEWGYADGSIRFFFSDNRKVCLLFVYGGLA